jgi:hypothetical protein
VLTGACTAAFDARAICCDNPLASARTRSRE